ncbi:MAG: hypothetical protein J7K87_01355 [Candidatus Aenigmarchaeota archaeon]|nr:hypothetical protein [Candidatus Aenigmarchaeota archaeon]
MEFVKDFKLGTKIFFKTWPFILLRIVLGFAFAAFVIIYFAFWFWLIFKFLNSISLLVSIIVFLISFGIFIKLYQLFVRYVMYMFKAAHISVIAEIFKTGAVPKGQVKFGLEKVKKHFLSSSGLFAVDLVIDSILREFHKLATRVESAIPIQQLRTLIKIIVAVISTVVSYIDEAILSYIFLKEDKNTWKSARDGIVLYAKNWKELLVVSGVLVIGLYLFTYIVFQITFSSGIIAHSFFAGLGTFVVWAIILAIVAVIYIGILQPYVQTIIITTFLNEIKDDTPDSKTMDWLMSISGKFRELVSKAGEKVASIGAKGAVPGAAPSSPAQFQQSQSKTVPSSPETKAGKMPPPALTCAICGAPLVEGKYWTCSRCGRKVCINHARTYNGKVYCTDCLKEMGVI